MILALGKFNLKRHENIFYTKSLAAVLCSSDAYLLPATGFGFWLTGKLGRAWHRCMGGAWVHGMVCGIFGLPYLFGVPEPVTSLLGGCDNIN